MSASFDEIVRTTRSVRRRLDYDRAVDLEAVRDCIDNAVQAPTGAGGEIWRFLLVSDPRVREGLSRLYREALDSVVRARGAAMKATQHDLADNLHRVPLIILVFGIGRVETASSVAMTSFYGSILPAAWSLMMSLRARGYGATWTTLLTLREEAVKDLVHAPDESSLTVMLPVAHRLNATLRPAHRQPAASVSYANRWGEPAFGEPASP